MSIVQYSHTRDPKMGKNGCTKKDVILLKPMKLGDGRAPIKNSLLARQKNRPFWPHPPQNGRFYKKGVQGSKSAKNGQNPPPKKQIYKKQGGGCRSGGGVPRRIKKSCQGSPLCFNFSCGVRGGGTPPNCEKGALGGPKSTRGPPDPPLF